MDEEALAQRMFAAYNAAAGGLTWDGKPIPPWESTGPKVQANWRAAAREAIASVGRAERDRCARLCDAIAGRHGGDASSGAAWCAAEIRRPDAPRLAEGPNR